MAAQTKTLLSYLIGVYGITQRKLASGLSMNQGKVSQLANGKTKAVSDKDRAALEEFFRIPIVQLLAPMEDDHEF